MINVKLNQFEGPLSLLLKLIESEKLGITEVSLVKIADQYIEYIKRSEYIKPEHMADFLVIAAKLIYIKSKALLPYLFPKEEEDIEELEKQLKMFKEFLEASREIEKRLKEKKFMFIPVDRKMARAHILKQENVFSPPKKIKKEDLYNTFKKFISRKKPLMINLEEKVLERKINIEDKIFFIENSLIEKIKLSFNDILKKAESKTEIVVSFLAVLELIKQRSVNASQEGLFEEILLSKQDNRPAVQ